MKIILSGATGFVGKEVLAQCLKDSRITSIIALSRRDIPSTEAKLKVVKIDDFGVYPDMVLKECAGAQGCIWSLGTYRDPDIETTRRVNVDYTTAAANAFKSLGREGAPFRFAYVSGAMVETDRAKKLWAKAEPRYIRGETENFLRDLDKQSPTTFQAFIIRLGMILNPNTMIPTFARNLSRSVRVDQVAAVLRDVAINGAWEGKPQTLEYNAIGPLGDSLLKEQIQ